MRAVLEDFSTPRLVTASKANLFEFYDYLGRSPKVELYDSPELKWLLAGPLNPFLDGVLRTRLNARNVDERIEDILAYFKSKNVRKFF